MESLEYDFEHNDLDINVVTELLERGSLQSLGMCLNNAVLYDRQTYCLAYQTLVKRVLNTSGVGSGKTLVSLALIEITKKLRNCKWIVVVEVGNLDAWKTKALKYTNLRFMTTSASKLNIDALVSNWNDSLDFVLVTYEALTNRTFINKALDMIKTFGNIIFDESVRIADFSSIVHKVAFRMSKKCEYVIQLNGTPVTSSPSQGLAQLSVLRGYDYSKFIDKFESVDYQGNKTYENLEELSQIFLPNIVGFSRKEMGIETVIENPTAVLLPNKDSDKMPYLRKQLERFRGKKIIIFANLNELKDAVYDTFGIPVIDGRNASKRTQLLKEFNSSINSICVTNIMRGADMECDVILFLEQTFDWEQVIGRGHRTFESKEMNVAWIIDDIVYFNKYIRDRGKLLGIFNDVDLTVIEIDKFDKC